MNNQLLREVANLIELEDRFDLGSWMELRDEDGNDYNPWRLDGVTPGILLDGTVVLDGATCQTVGCIAGWVCACSRPTEVLSEVGIELHARQDLGLTAGQSNRLFTADCDTIWAELAPQFGWRQIHCLGCTAPGLAEWSEITAVQAAKVLRMIADGEVKL